jgi:hypothetical protein
MIIPHDGWQFPAGNIASIPIFPEIVWMNSILSAGYLNDRHPALQSNRAFLHRFLATQSDGVAFPAVPEKFHRQSAFQLCRDASLV